VSASGLVPSSEKWGEVVVGDEEWAEGEQPRAAPVWVAGGCLLRLFLGPLASQTITLANLRQTRRGVYTVNFLVEGAVDERHN
jgi:hypothetical protein